MILIHSFLFYFFYQLQVVKMINYLKVDIGDHYGNLMMGFGNTLYIKSVLPNKNNNRHQLMCK